MLVDNITNAFQKDCSDHDCDGDDGSFNGSDEDMSDGDEPDDMMTLVQYQEEARKENLIRKGTYETSSSHKKGRVDTVVNGV